LLLLLPDLAALVRVGIDENVAGVQITVDKVVRKAHILTQIQKNIFYIYSFAESTVLTQILKSQP
jgi:hypothetical protein